MIPILYNKCAPYSGFAKFDTHKIESATTVEVKGECSQVDHVFAGTKKDPDYSSEVALLHGELIQIFGGSLEIIVQEQKGEQGNSTAAGDVDEIALRVTHDGTSPEILIIYGTKEKNT